VTVESFVGQYLYEFVSFSTESFVDGILFREFLAVTNGQRQWRWPLLCDINEAIVYENINKSRRDDLLLYATQPILERRVKGKQ
jgi:hypothetical protein